MPTTTGPLTVITPADLRAEFARRRVRIYLVASKIGVHPSKLSLVLNERQPLPPELATRIAEALQEL